MIDCHHCQHFYITWDKAFPYGCRAIGFKSRQIPCVSVRVNSGKECLLFQKRKKRATHSR
jgi:hypothetical protein